MSEAPYIDDKIKAWLDAADAEDSAREARLAAATERLASVSQAVSALAGRHEVTEYDGSEWVSAYVVDAIPGCRVQVSSPHYIPALGTRIGSFDIRVWNAQDHAAVMRALVAIGERASLWLAANADDSGGVE